MSGKHSSWCRTCADALKAEVQRRPEVKARRRVRHVLDPRKQMLTSARQRAKRAGVPFSLDVGDLLVPATCPVLGIPIAVVGDQHDGSPSLDRIKPALGYVPGNIRVISKLANQLRNSATFEQARLIWLDAVRLQEMTR